MRHTRLLGRLRLTPSLIKSIQHGVATLTNGAGTVTIAAVDPAHTLIFYLGSRGTASASNDARMWCGRLTLTSSTQLTITAATTGSYSTPVAWAVIEFWPGVLKSVQRGTIALGSGTPANASITPVNLSRAHLTWLGITTAITDAVSAVFPTLQLTAADNVRAVVADNLGTDSTVGFQVAEWL